MTDVSALGIKVTGTGIVKTTNELDKFAIAAREAGKAASRPINVKISGSASKALADLRAMERSLNAVRSATKSGVNIRIGSAGNAKAIADLAKMGTALREARAAARTPINVRVTQTGAEAVVTALDRVTAAANRARAASNVNVRASGGGSPAMPVPTSGDIGAVTSLTNAVKGLVSAYALLQGVKVYATLVDESKMLTAQLKLATAETGSFAQAQKDVRDIAASSRSDLDSTATLYSKLQINAAQLGLTQKEVATVTEATIKAFKVSGATTVETSNSIRQLIQGLQSGVLRGEEFNSVMEQAPRLQKAIADSLGKSNGELRAMAEEGKLTGAVVTKAILEASEKIRSEFDQIPATFADAMTQIRNAAVITFGAFDQGGEFSKAITSFLIGGTQGMADMEAAALRMGGAVRGEIDGLVAALKPAINDFRELIDLLGIGKQTADSGIFSPLFKELDAITAWYADNKWWISPLDVTPGSRTNLSRPYEEGRDRAAGRAALKDIMGNDPFAQEGAERYRFVEKETRAIVAQTNATKGLTDAQKAAKKAADEAQRAYEARVKAADAYIEQLQRENAEFGKSAKEIRLMEVARRMEAAATDAQREAIQRASDQRENNIGVKEAADAIKAAEAKATEIRLIEEETRLMAKFGEERRNALRGLSGDALEDEMARINMQHQIESINLRANAEASLDAANAAHILARAKAEVAAVQQGASDDRAERQLEQDRRRALETAYEIADIVGGSIGNAVGALADALGQFDKLMGGDNASGIGKWLKDTKVFGKALGDIVKEMGAGARIGGAVDGIFDAIGVKSSKAGAQIGGAIGQFGGPLGAIAGSIVGGIVGGMLKSTPRASATVSIIAGEAMETAVRGSSDKLKKVASGLADGVLSGLTDLAESLGAELVGNASVSIGQRKGNYRVDTTGQGITKTSRGAVDFGEDQAAAIAFALQDAIRDGVLGGLSASMEKLITGDGDLQSQLQKALSFKGVFDELAQRDDPAKWAQDEVTRWHTAMAKIFAEAGATADELAELERLTGIKRADAAREAADKIASQAREAMEEENKLNSMRAQILRLEGKEIEAVNLERQIETSTMTAAEKALKLRIYALEDEIAAAEKAAAIADERKGLERQLLELNGDTNAIRALDLAQLDASNRALQELIWKRQDEIAAAEKATARVNEMNGLYIRLAEAQGNTALVKQLRRQQELNAATDDTARKLLRQIYAAEDAAEAIEKLNKSLQGIQSNFMRGGKPTDPGGTYQKMLEAATAAEDERLRVQEERITRLTAAYEREADAFRTAIDAFKDARAGMQEFLDEIFGKSGAFDDFMTLQRKFMQAGALAATGDLASMQQLPGLGRDYLQATRDRSSTKAEFQRQALFIASVVGDAIGAADVQIDYNQAQLDYLKQQVSAHIETNEKLETVISVLGEILGEEREGRSENTQLLLSIENSNYKIERTQRLVTRGGVATQVEQDF